MYNKFDDNQVLEIFRIAKIWHSKYICQLPAPGNLISEIPDPRFPPEFPRVPQNSDSEKYHKPDSLIFYYAKVIILIVGAEKFQIFQKVRIFQILKFLGFDN